MGLASQLRHFWRVARRKGPKPKPDATLVLRRPGGRFGWLAPAWVVEMDGARLAKLRRGRERRVPVFAGRHKLNLWAGDVGSLPMPIALAPGETAVIEALTMKRAVELGLVDDGFAPDPLLLRRVG